MNSQNVINAEVAITPKRFWDAFAEALKGRFADAGSGFREAYVCGDEWTACMTGFLKKLADRFDCHVDCEYWPRVDVAYFDRSTKRDWEPWSMEAAIEHEIGPYWCESEVCKLMMVNSGLKVIIAYEDEDLVIKGALNEFVEILQSRKYSNAARWLFILGPRVLADGRDYHAFSYDGSTIDEITGERNILCPS